MIDHEDHAVRRHDDGRKVYVIGPVERWVVGIAASLMIALLYAYGTTVMGKLDTVAATGLRIEIAQAVTSNDINELKAKQALMQTEVAKIPRIEIQVQNNTDKLRERANQ
jgi:hypothetical protein